MKIFWSKVTPAAEIFVYYGISREEVIFGQKNQLGSMG